MLSDRVPWLSDAQLGATDSLLDEDGLVPLTASHEQHAGGGASEQAGGGSGTGEVDVPLVVGVAAGASAVVCLVVGLLVGAAAGLQAACCWPTSRAPEMSG